MISLTTTALGRRFGSRGVFRDLTFSAKQGEIIAISGPNGSGKSTLIKTLLGLIPPSAGTIKIELSSKTLDRNQRLDISAAVTPYFQVYDSLSAFENIAFFSRLRGVSFNSTTAEESISAFGLSGRGDDWLSEYSSGMRQRLKLVLALYVSPKLLFLDEPGVNLDESGKQIVYERVKAYSPRALIFWATNDPQELRFADRVISLA